MGLARRSGGHDTNTWPGFVDAMTALLMIMMFVLSIFMIFQFTMHEKLTGQTKELDDLTQQLAGLANVLSLEKSHSAELEGQVGELKSNLAGQRTQLDQLTAALAAMTSKAEGSAAEVDRLNAAMAALVKSRDTAEAQSKELQANLDESVSARQALEAALAAARSETDAAAEEARLAAARREALEAMVKDLQAKDKARDDKLAGLQAEQTTAMTLIQQLRQERAQGEQSLGDSQKVLDEADARRKEALALIAELEQERDKLKAQTAEAQQNLDTSQQKLSKAEEERLLQLTAADTLRKKLNDLEAKLSEADQARIAEAAAAEALKEKLANSTTELDAMTLALESARKEAEQTLTLLAASEAAKKSLQGQLEDGGAAIDREQALRKVAEQELASAKEQTVEEQRRVALLNAQVKELRDQLGGLQALLGEAEKRDADSKVQIAKLGERLNAALAQKVGELARYRSVFFEKMEQVLGNRQGIKRVGDRFVFQSEVLFAPGQATLGPDGEAQLAKLGAVVRDIAKEVPPDVAWILRVDGHTDKTPLGGGGRYRDNWELSQARALSVVEYLIDKEKIPPNHLAAAGFGEYQPVDPGDSPEALAKNRRIEFKFTER